MDVNRSFIHALLPTGPELELCRESFTAQRVKRGNKLTVRTFQESKASQVSNLGGSVIWFVGPRSKVLMSTDMDRLCLRTRLRWIIPFRGLEPLKWITWGWSNSVGRMIVRIFSGYQPLIEFTFMFLSSVSCVV